MGASRIVDNCLFMKPLLYFPGKTRNRPDLTESTRKYVWREASYQCAIPGCGRFGVEIHHIVPWREAVFWSGEPHSPLNLIALCPSHHAQADNEQISRVRLRKIKDGLLRRYQFSENAGEPWADRVWSTEASLFRHIRDCHRDLIYRGHEAQFQDYLLQLSHSLRKNKSLYSSRGVIVLAALGGVYRRRGSNYFRRAEHDLNVAAEIARDLRRTRLIGSELGRIYYDLGYISLLRNEYDSSVAFLERSREFDRQAKQTIGLKISDSVKELAISRMQREFNPKLLAENLQIFENSDDPDARRWVANANCHLAEFSLANHNPEKSLRYLETARSVNDTLGLSTGRAKFYFLVGRAHLGLKDKDKALRALSTAFELYNRFHIKEGYADVCYLYGKILIDIGSRSEAIPLFEHGLSADPGMDNRAGIANCQYMINILGV